MKKYETLKMIVMLQAVSMIAFAGFLVWQLWPKSLDEEVISPIINQSKADADDEVVAVIAEQPITKQQLVDELLTMYGDQTLKEMLEHYAIRFAAKEYSITVTEQEIQEELAERAAYYDSVDEYIEVMTKEVGILPNKLHQDVEDELLLNKIAIKDIVVTEQEISTFLSDYPNRFMNKYEYELAWIVTDASSTANEVLLHLEEGQTFSQLAELYSLDEQSSHNGGKIGVVSNSEIGFPQHMLDVVASIEVGSIAGPIEYENQYVIVKLLGKNHVKIITEEERVELAKSTIALERAEPLEQVLIRLVNQYGSVIKKQNL